mmetsp:Transcript_8596/g.20110  ORF Transcript_8596/g.20110 Transcript_8596/m.20110 type:complete len:245 (-) Transcript_8596:659-1393(-)
MSTYRAGGMKPPGLTSKSDPFDQVVAGVIANDQPQLLPAKFGTLLNEQHLVHPSIHGSLWASLYRWMGDSMGALISTKIICWNKDGAAPTSVEYADFAEQFESKPGDKFEKMLNDVHHLHRMIELNTRTVESKIKEKEISASSKLAKLISDADLKLEAKLAEIKAQCASLRTPTESVDGDGARAPASAPSVEFRETAALLSELNERSAMARRVHLEEIDKSSNDLQGALEASVVTINFEAESAT